MCLYQFILLILFTLLLFIAVSFLFCHFFLNVFHMRALKCLQRGLQESFCSTIVANFMVPSYDPKISTLISQLILWRHIIRNCTIRIRDSHRLTFLKFLLRVKELVNSDCRLGFGMKNYISQLEMSRILIFDPNIRHSRLWY